VRTERLVLAVVHTVATAGHVLDAVELLEQDLRVQVAFVQAPDTFSGGVHDLLHRLGGVVIGWRQATQLDFDLVIAADCAGVHELHGPVLMLAHGVMNNKLAPAALADPTRALVVGLAAPWLTWYGRLVPATVALTHHGLLTVLAEQCPQAVPVAEVTGDLCLDRLVASLGHRAAYRAALQVPPGRTLVAISSTWGPDGLLGARREVLYDLLSGLPSADFSLRMVVHPSIWFGHGPRQVMGWLHRHRRTGLRVVAPSSWRALVAGADVVIGDHGSATIYAAAAGIPVLLASGRPDQVAPGSASELLYQVAPVLDRHRPLTEQVAYAMGPQRQAAQEPVAAAVSSEPGRAAELLAARMYRVLGLGEPVADHVAEPVGPPVLIDR
jgi:hypothetical protein